MRTRSGLQYRRGGASFMGPLQRRSAVARAQQFRRGQSFTMNRRRRQTSGIGITTQHDERRIYRKKSMPRRQKRRWKTFKNKVLAVSEKDLGSRMVVFNKTYTFSNTNPANHAAGNLAIYPGASGNAYLNDMVNIVSTEVGTWTAASGEVIDKTSKYIFKSAVLDLTFRNSSTFTAASTPAPDSSAKMETDVYEIIVGHSGTDTSGVYTDLFAMLQAGFTDTLNIGGAGTGLGLQVRGVTPFECCAGLSRFKIKILKKTKFMTPNGDTFTYQVRDPRRHVGDQNFINLNGVNIRGWTRWVLFISKLVPGLTVGTGAGTYQESIDVGVTRKYFYKIEGVSEDRDRFIAA